MVDNLGLGASKKRREKNKRYYNKHHDEILKKQSLYQKKKRKGIAKTEEELTNMNRDKFGRFLKTTGSTKYKKKQRDGKTKGEHVLIWEDYYQKKLPIGWCVHHKNENKKDNRIENLKAMTISKHTKYHFDKYYKNNNVWNKGITTHYGNNSLGHKVTQKTKNKQKCSWFNKSLDSNIDIWRLRDKGFTPIKISKELNLTINQVNQRWMGFNKVIDMNSGRLI